MSSQRQRQVNFRDLVEEGKKRIVILVICVVGLSYLMSRKFFFFLICCDLIEVLGKIWVIFL